MSEVLRRSEDPGVETQQSIYSVRVASSSREKRQVFRLRYNVFCREQAGAPLPWGIERDRFDTHAQHLVVTAPGKWPLTGSRVVGTYRLIHDVAQFYSETEFELGRIHELRPSILELGRACVAVGHRNGAVLQLLWRGMTEQAARLGKDYLLGCSSVPAPPDANIAQLSADLESQGLLDLSWGARPLVERTRPSGYVGPVPKLPSLVAMYLKAGARLVSPPMYDNDFGCFDFLTLCNLKSVQHRFHRFLSRASEF